MSTNVIGIVELDIKVRAAKSSRKRSVMAVLDELDAAAEPPPILPRGATSSHAGERPRQPSRSSIPPFEDVLEVADYADGLASEHALSDVPTDFQ